jgi:hypothetical protein
MSNNKNFVHILFMDDGRGFGIVYCIAVTIGRDTCSFESDGLVINNQNLLSRFVRKSNSSECHRCSETTLNRFLFGWKHGGIFAYSSSKSEFDLLRKIIPGIPLDSSVGSVLMRIPY